MRGVDVVTPGVDVSCPAPTPAADHEIAVSQPDQHQPGFEFYRPLTLTAGTYRAVVCWHDDDDPVNFGALENNGGVFAFFPDGEEDNEVYWTETYEFMNVSFPMSVTGTHETLLMIPTSGVWRFDPAFSNADWRLSLWRV